MLVAPNFTAAWRASCVVVFSVATFADNSATEAIADFADSGSVGKANHWPDGRRSDSFRQRGESTLSASNLITEVPSADALEPVKAISRVRSRGFESVVFSRILWSI